MALVKGGLPYAGFLFTPISQAIHLAVYLWLCMGVLGSQEPTHHTQTGWGPWITLLHNIPAVAVRIRIILRLMIMITFRNMIMLMIMIMLTFLNMIMLIHTFFHR